MDSPADRLDQALTEILRDLSTEDQVSMHLGDEEECNCDDFEDGEPWDMELHVICSCSDDDEKEEYQVKAVTYIDLMMPLSINDTPVQIPFRIRLIKLA